jgi:hypothetical protein
LGAWVISHQNQEFNFWVSHCQVSLQEVFTWLQACWKSDFTLFQFASVALVSASIFWFNAVRWSRSD